MAAPGQPSPQQIAAMQQQFAAEAARRGMSPEDFAKQQREQLNAEAAKQGVTTEQYVAQLRMRALAAQQKAAEVQRQLQAQGNGGAAQPGQQGPPGQGPQPGPQQHTQQVPVNPNNPKNPKAIAVAQFLRSQNLKTRTCVLDGQRKDMFKGDY
jgi:translocation protein SEC62